MAATIARLIPGNQGYDLLCRINHTSDTSRKNGIPHVTRVTFKINGSEITRIDCGPGISSNPQIGVYLEDVDHQDLVEVHWIDSAGNRGHLKATAAELLGSGFYQRS